MNFWDTITGNDLTREWRVFEARAAALPMEYQEAWREIVGHAFPYGNFTGRNLMPILDGALGLLEESAAEGQDVDEVVGEDRSGFAQAITGGEDARTFRDRWRQQLNRTVARKLKQLGD